MSAAAMRSGAPASVVTPLCGKATSWMSIQSRKASRTLMTASRLSRPTSLSISTWLRTRVAPFAISVADERRGAGLDRQGDPMALGALERDALAHAAPLDMGQARRAKMGLVEMEVAVDKRRQEEQAVEVDAVVGRRLQSPARESRR